MKIKGSNTRRRISQNTRCDRTDEGGALHGRKSVDVSMPFLGRMRSLETGARMDPPSQRPGDRGICQMPDEINLDGCSLDRWSILNSNRSSSAVLSCQGIDISILRSSRSPTTRFQNQVRRAQSLRTVVGTEDMFHS